MKMEHLKSTNFAWKVTQAGWPSGLRRWFKAPVTSVARVRISLLSILCIDDCIQILSNTVRDFKTVSNLTLTESYN